MSIKLPTKGTLNQGSDQSWRIADRVQQLNSKTFDSSSGERFRGSVMISGVDHTFQLRKLFLDGFDGAPQHSLGPAAVVCVRMKETDGSTPVSPMVDHGGGDPDGDSRYYAYEHQREHVK
ncbi:ubiquitin system component Cue protein [Striga asiatica]|uniref:Ubiquitin system component Cue protein n=1 Tax=Striga asiatica TaxID=4170 RepID=A0A5A7R0R0_STRAF|nr:ubiquitin system component Cue protein [Striga asiatica]